MISQEARKYLAIALIVFFVSSFLPMNLFAAGVQGTEETVVLTMGQKNYKKANKLVETDIAPYIKDGRTMVPVAFVAPALGTEKALWHPEEEKVTIKKDDILITIFIGQDEILVNNKKMKMDTVAEIANLGNGGGRTMIPIVFIARALEIGYEWQEVTRTVHFYGKTWVYDKSGTYGPAITPELYEGNVIIKADGVTLQNMQIKGNLTIAKEVKDGTVKLNNVTVLGETYVRGGGQDSIHINGGDYGKILVQKQDGKVRIVATNTEGIEVVISEDATGEEVILNGNFEKVTVEAEEIKISTQGQTVIEKMEVAKEAKGVEIELSKETVVKEASFESNADIRGQGKIGKADVKADGVNLGVAVDNVQVAQGTSQPSTEGSSSNTTTTGGSGGSSSGGSSTPTVSVITITTLVGGVEAAGPFENDATVQVTLVTATDGAEIRYTTDGTDPTPDSYPYTVAINVLASNEAGKTFNFKAKAFKTGYTASAVASKTIVFMPTEAKAVEAANTELGKVVAALGDYTSAGGNVADAVYTDVEAAKTALQTAVDADPKVIGDITVATAALTAKLGLLGDAKDALIARAQDNADIATAKAAIEAGTYTTTQAEAGDAGAAAIKAQALVNALALEGTRAIIVAGDFTAATAGTALTPAGTEGSFKFTVKVNKGSGTEQISDEQTMTITATAYDSTAQDNTDIARAKAAIEAGTYTATQAAVGDASAAATKAQTLVNALELEGTTATIVAGDFTAATAGTSLADAGTNGSFKFTVKVNKGSGTEQISAEQTMTIIATEYEPSSDVKLSDLTIDGKTVTGFNLTTVIYNVELEAGTIVVPTVAATVSDTGKATVKVTNAESLPGATTVLVIAEDRRSLTYTINFTVATD